MPADRSCKRAFTARLVRRGWNDIRSVSYSRRTFCLVVIPILYKVWSNGPMLKSTELYEQCDTTMDSSRVLSGRFHIYPIPIFRNCQEYSASP